MPRKYELRQRAERQDQTRQRIVNATIALHTTVGPARTSVSAIAQRAGVQRHTVYHHFPDAQSLGLACSGQFMGEHPLPDPGPWRNIADAEQRLRRGLTELYSYYESHANELAPIVRDAEDDALTREMLELRIAPQLANIRRVLAEPIRTRGARQARKDAMLDLMMTIQSWRQLAASMSRPQAVEAAVRGILNQ
jgi:AcrR family transcriptional regulator